MNYVFTEKQTIATTWLKSKTGNSKSKSLHQAIKDNQWVFTNLANILNAQNIIKVSCPTTITALHV